MNESVAQLLFEHARSYNTDRAGVAYVICRCGLQIEIGRHTIVADDYRAHAAHQAEILLQVVSIAEMATIIREHWASEVPHPMYPTYVQCMKQGCEWDGRFLGDISGHVAELIASATK